MQAICVSKRNWAVLIVAVPALAQLTPQFHTEVNLVRVPCVVTDGHGTPVTGLRAEDFVVLDDGKRRQVTSLWRESDLPLTVGLLVDVSGSQQNFVDQHRQTILQFLARVLSHEDRAFLVSLEWQPRLVTDLTNSIERLQSGAEALGSQQFPILGDPCKKGTR